MVAGAAIAGGALVALLAMIGGLFTTTYLTSEGRGGRMWARVLPTPFVGSATAFGFKESSAYSYMVSAWDGSLGIMGQLLWLSIGLLLMVWIFNLLFSKEAGEAATLVR